MHAGARLVRRDSTTPKASGMMTIYCTRNESEMPARAALLLISVVVSVAFASQVAAGQSHVRAGAVSHSPAEAGGAAARTPWGDPDLQGVWSSATRTPLERPAEFG